MHDSEYQCIHLQHPPHTTPPTPLDAQMRGISSGSAREDAGGLCRAGCPVHGCRERHRYSVMPTGGTEMQKEGGWGRAGGLPERADSPHWPSMLRARSMLCACSIGVEVEVQKARDG
jgi:hypothetical protein